MVEMPFSLKTFSIALITCVEYVCKILATITPTVNVLLIFKLLAITFG